MEELNDDVKRKKSYFHKKEWTRTKKQVARNSKEAKGRPIVNCKHNNTSAYCKVYDLTEEDIEGKVAYYFLLLS